MVTAMFRYSYNALAYFGETIEKSIERTARYGYDAIELMGEPQEYDTRKVKRACGDAGIVVSSICSVYWGEERDFANTDKLNREKTLNYTKSVIDLAAAVGASIVTIAPRDRKSTRLNSSH